MAISNSSFYAVLMILAGIGIPIMGALSSGLGARIQNPAFAVSILLVVAFCTSIVSLLLFSPSPIKLYQSPTPFYFYLGGIFFVFYISSVTWVAPKFGVGNAIAFVLLGQLISIATIDHFGLMGANQYALTLKRMIGLALMAGGVFLVASR